MIEQHVVNSELSKKLKELGVKQESYFHWGNPPFAKDGFNILHFDEWQDSAKCGYETYSAFLVSELGEMLPAFVSSDIQWQWKDAEGFWHWRENAIWKT